MSDSESESWPKPNCSFLAAPIAFGFSEPYQFEPQLTEEEVKKRKQLAAQKQVTFACRHLKVQIAEIVITLVFT